MGVYEKAGKKVRVVGLTPQTARKCISGEP
jgi:hypothetical protein